MVTKTYCDALDDGIVLAREKEERRGHMGYSQIGKEDERWLWLSFRWCLPPIRKPRTLRIFDNGDAVEELLTKWTHQASEHPDHRDLRLITINPETGEQFRFKRYGGHVAGSMDGCIYGVPDLPTVWMVWEAKSANDDRFKALLKQSDGTYRPVSWDNLVDHGLKSWSPEYWGQVQCYMGETGMRHALVAVYDKNTSEVHHEIIEFDELAYQSLVSKAERLVDAPEPPTSMYPSAADYRCKILMTEEEREIYWAERLPPTANCRNCRFSQPLTDEGSQDAQWHCRKHNALCGTTDQQEAGCTLHQFIPELMPARHQESRTTDEGVVYKTYEGVEFINGPDGFSSDELIELAKQEFEMLADPTFAEMRKQLGAQVVPDRDDFDPDEDIPF